MHSVVGRSVGYWYNLLQVAPTRHSVRAGLPTPGFAAAASCAKLYAPASFLLLLLLLFSAVA
jgi:hypothetical protein